MKNRLYLLIIILIIIVFGTLTILLLDQPFGFQFNFSFYTLIIGLLLILIKTTLYLFNKRSLLSRIGGIILGVMILGLIVGTLIISYDYRIFYFKSPIPKPTKSEWQEDLNYLSNELRSVHPDIYSMVSKEKLDSLENEIYNRIPSSSESSILMDLFRFTALPNDAHTFPFIFFPCFDIHNLPIQVYGFNDGWYIVDAARGYKDLIGAKILKIELENIEDIFIKSPVLLATENRQSKRERFTYMVVIPEWLKYNGIIDDIDNVNITFVDINENIVKRNLQAYKYFPTFVWSNVFKIENNKPPVFTNPRKDWYQFTPIKNGDILYIEYHQCNNQEGKETVEEFAVSLENHINTNNYERYIIDLRSNDGGDSNVNNSLIDIITKSEKISQYGKLYVLIGRRTFSAAVMFANQLQMLANPIFIGEGTGQGPNFFGGPNLIELPNSKLVFGISSRNTIGGLSFDKRNMIEPDIEIEYTIDDFLSNNDPTLIAAINHVPEDNSSRYPGNISDELIGEYSISNKDYAEIFEADNRIYLKITDYVPDGLSRFNSLLYNVSDSKYLTKIENCYIEFDRNSTGINFTYFGKTIPFNKIVGSKQLAMKMLSDGEIDLGINEIRNNRDYYINTYKNLEGILNSLGYRLMGFDKLKQAVLVFDENVNLFPKSSNVYDSLAESYMECGEYELAIENYNKSLELNPHNTNAINMLNKINQHE